MKIILETVVKSCFLELKLNILFIILDYYSSN